ncbi:hypothetical protein C0Q70_15770 [Pomacea canaliculata]|uniref:UspA domain-containing protein n=1 Tax=Pomacea canaliculata TaxID=400727 RepID=A0A2T7NVT0_POMCA|nr:hypothetical protein C0Q70_15770 [Pomacea canaliculata]
MQRRIMHKRRHYIKEIHRPGYRLHQEMKSLVMAQFSRVQTEARGTDSIHDLKLKEDNKIKLMKEKFTKLMEENNVEGEFHILGGKDTWHKVIEYQHNINAIMIVVGSRGLNAIRRTFMGSVSDSIVHHASCPVLVCRHP